MNRKLIAVLVAVPLVLGSSSVALAAESTKPAKSHSHSVADVKKAKGKKAQEKHAAKPAKGAKKAKASK
ncbi:MAG: hypothetical protein RIS80_769 [Actinomycetota bacterium]|jgi:hypothetical protein